MPDDDSSRMEPGMEVEGELIGAGLQIPARVKRFALAVGFLVLLGPSFRSAQINLEDAIRQGGQSNWQGMYFALVALTLISLLVAASKRTSDAGKPERSPRNRKSDGEGPRCEYCGKVLYRVHTCRKCGGQFCNVHGNPSRHDCPHRTALLPVKSVLLALILLASTVVAGYFLFSPRPVELPTASRPLQSATMLEPIWSLDLVDLNMTQCHHSSPTVADLDNDGRKEILLAYRRSFGSCYASGPGENRLLCADDEGQVKWIFPPLDRPEMAGHPMTSTTLSDLDGDGYLEILIGRRGSSDESCAAVHCLNHDGNEIWNYTMEGMLGAVTADPQVYDQDGDGRPEIYVASGYSPYGFDRQQGRMTVLDPEGDEIWVKEVDGYAEWPPLVWDIDKDGQGEIVICLNSNVVLCLDAGDGREEWRYKMEGEEPIMVTPVAADVDNDGRYEIIFTGPDGDLYVLSDRGKKEWRFRKPTEGTVRFGIPIGDIDGDSHMETCFMDDELLYCIDLYDRSIEWTFKPETPNHYSNYNTFADVTGDGEIDVLVVAPCLYVLSNRGIHLASFDTPKLIRDDRALSGMWSGDLDDDGLVEILVKFEGDGLYCLATGSTYKAENMIWPKCLHNNENRPVVPMEDGKYQGAQ